MNEIPLQSLSRCEAIQMHKDIVSAIITAYKGGLLDKFWLTNSGTHPMELVDNARFRLNEAGLDVSRDFAAMVIVDALSEIVREEQTICEKGAP